MILTMMKGKIHRAMITRCDIHYEGSISIDAALMEEAGILPNEQVDVLDITNGARFTTYAIEAEPDSGMIGVNGAAARLVQLGDLVIVIAYAQMDDAEAKRHKPRVVPVDAKNKAMSK
jgi:aspartate 1-decarboxylase